MCWGGASCTDLKTTDGTQILNKKINCLTKWINTSVSILLGHKIYVILSQYLHFTFSMAHTGEPERSLYNSHLETLTQINSVDQFPHHSWQLCCFGEKSYFYISMDWSVGGHDAYLLWLVSFYTTYRNDPKFVIVYLLHCSGMCEEYARVFRSYSVREHEGLGDRWWDTTKSYHLSVWSRYGADKGSLPGEIWPESGRLYQGGLIWSFFLMLSYHCFGETVR